MDAVAAYDLTKEYNGQSVLAGLNLQVPQGELFACVGEKGCGKTTLIRLLSGLAKPTTGECTVLGFSPHHEPQRLHMVAGTVLESAKLYKGMTLWENLRFFAGLHGMDDNDSLERSSFLLHKLDIWEGRDFPVENLTTGVIRRASLARALMHSPKILLADESSAGLDQETAEAIQNLISCVAQEEGLTLFLCSSNMAYAQKLCSNFAILKQGALLAKGDLESLREGAGVNYRAQLRLAEDSPAPAGFQWIDGVWEKELKVETDMPKIIAQAVGEGLSLYEARLIRPTLKEIYTAWLEGRRRKVVEDHETDGESQEIGACWEKKQEQLPEGDAEEESLGEIPEELFSGEDSAGEIPEELYFGEESPGEVPTNSEELQDPGDPGEEI